MENTVNMTPSEVTICDVCAESTCDPVLLSFSQMSDKNCAKLGMDSLIGTGYLCKTCFAESSLNFTDKWKHRRIKDYFR